VPVQLNDAPGARRLRFFCLVVQRRLQDLLEVIVVIPAVSEPKVKGRIIIICASPAVMQPGKGPQLLPIPPWQ
jgi:hypothetical protein